MLGVSSVDYVDEAALDEAARRSNEWEDTRLAEFLRDEEPLDRLEESVEELVGFISEFMDKRKRDVRVAIGLALIVRERILQAKASILAIEEDSLKLMPGEI